MSYCIGVICKCGRMIFAGRKDVVTAEELGRFALGGYTVKTIDDKAEFAALNWGCKCQKQHGAHGTE